MELTGLHHVSALTAHAPENVTFYTQVMGMRLVKKTVNQDDTTSYHLFYGDEIGNPGTELTFFDIPFAAPTKPGASSISQIALRVTGNEALEYWQARLAENGVTPDPITTVAGRSILAFRDFEGQRLALIDDKGARLAGGTPWDRSPVPAANGIRGLGAVTLTVRNLDPTARVLTDVMGFREVGSSEIDENATRTIFETGVGGPGAQVFVEERRNLPFERLGRGGVHHVAFRVPDDEAHAAWLERIESFGIRNSGQVDRFYFRALYFREPNGILFELSTDGPGFATDEPAATLGEKLALPPFLEPRRAEIEAKLKPLPTEHLSV